MCDFSSGGDLWGVDSSTDINTESLKASTDTVTEINELSEGVDFSEDESDFSEGFASEQLDDSMVDIDLHEDINLSDDSIDIEESMYDDINLDHLEEIDNGDVASELNKDISGLEDRSIETAGESIEFLQCETAESNERKDCPSVEEVNGYEFTKDNEGRVSEVEGDLLFEKGDRNIEAQRSAGGEYRRETDEGGHLIGNRFNGPGGDVNLVAQNRNLNRSGYKALENEWARELNNGNDVHVKIDPIYQDGVERPHAIMGEYDVDSEKGATKEYFSFTNEDLRSEEFKIDDYDFKFPKED